MRFWATLALAGLFATSCGDDGQSADSPFVEPDDSTNQPADGADQPADDQSPADDVPSPEPSGPVAVNTIRIGSQVWERTLPMTTGQCFLFEDDENLPTSANVWGTLDGDDEVTFSAVYGQDGTFKARVDNQFDIFWFAGAEGGGVDDLVIELDFETLTVSGTGTFTNAAGGDTAAGSFEFQCEE